MLQQTVVERLPRESAVQLHVLLVEDSAADANLIRMILAETGIVYKLDIALDGQDALDILHGRRGRFADWRTPDLILLDLNLPRKDGLEVLEDIRADSQLRRIPVVVLTSSSNPKDVIAAYDRGANMYCKKPFQLEELEQLIEHIAATWLLFACLPPAQRGDQVR